MLNGDGAWRMAAYSNKWQGAFLNKKKQHSKGFPKIIESPLPCCAEAYCKKNQGCTFSSFTCSATLPALIFNM